MPIRNDNIEQQGQSGNRGGYRYNVRVSFESPCVDEEIFEHPTLVEFLERVLGPDYVWSHFDSNIPLPNADYQHWHRDSQLLFPKLMPPTFQVGVKFPLVDTHEENGSFEVIPRTQYVANEDPQSEMDDVLEPGSIGGNTQYV